MHMQHTKHKTPPLRGLHPFKRASLAPREPPSGGFRLGRVGTPTPGIGLNPEGVQSKLTASWRVSQRLPTPAVPTGDLPAGARPLAACRRHSARHTHAPRPFPTHSPPSRRRLTAPPPRRRLTAPLHTTNRRRALGVRLCYFPFFSHRHTIRSLERGCHARPFFLVRLAPPYPCFTRVGGGAISSKLQVASRKSQVARSK